MSEIQEPELLPCPFCGGEAKIYDYTSYLDVCSVACITCGNGTTSDYYKLSDAVEAWNRRVPVSESAKRFYESICVDWLKHHVPAAGQWTTEPNENGLYVVQVRGYGIFKLTVVKVMGGCVKDWHGSTYAKEDFCKMNDSLMWLKLDVPPLPEGKESNE